jgi:hypothetical protein
MMLTLRPSGPVLLLCQLATVIACGQSPADLSQARTELSRLHAADREAHFKTDVALLLDPSVEQMISVSDGEIRLVGKADRSRTLAEYFRNARYSAWDDLEAPIIHVSKDASMGWIITRLKVQRTQPDSSGSEHEQQFVYAGIMTYEKVDGRWMKVANVSTFAPQP